MKKIIRTIQWILIILQILFIKDEYVFLGLLTLQMGLIVILDIFFQN